MAPEPTEPVLAGAVPPQLYHFLTHTVRAPLANLQTLLHQGLLRPAESASHARMAKALHQAQDLMLRLDAFNQTFWPPVDASVYQESLLDNLIDNACEQLRPQASARQQILQVHASAQCAFVACEPLLLVQAITATLQLCIAQAPQGATIALHSLLQADFGVLHLSYGAAQGECPPGGRVTHSLQLPGLVYDGGFRTGPTTPA